MTPWSELALTTARVLIAGGLVVLTIKTVDWLMTPAPQPPLRY